MISDPSATPAGLFKKGIAIVENNMTGMKEIMKKIQTGADLFVVFSDCTKLPFVECDETTFDDEVLIFTEKELAGTKYSVLVEQGDPVRVLNLPVKNRLPFFVSLYSLGVNAVLVNQGAVDEVCIPLENVVKRPDLPRFSHEKKQEMMEKKMQVSDMQFRIENPEFHLTSIYYIQLLKSKRAKDSVEELKELNEEMLAHYRKGSYIAVRSEKNKIPLLQRTDSDCFQPLFTDAQEFMKFQQKNPAVKLKTSIVTEREVLEHMDPAATGVVINPMGVGIIFRIRKKENK